MTFADEYDDVLKSLANDRTVASTLSLLAESFEVFREEEPLQNSAVPILAFAWNKNYRMKPVHSALHQSEAQELFHEMKKREVVCKVSVTGDEYVLFVIESDENQATKIVRRFLRLNNR